MYWMMYADSAVRGDNLQVKISVWSACGVPAIVDIGWVEPCEFTLAELHALYPKTGMGAYNDAAQRAYQDVKARSGSTPVLAIPWTQRDLWPLTQILDDIVAPRRQPVAVDPLADLEARVKALESEVAGLKRRLRASATP